MSRPVQKAAHRASAVNTPPSQPPVKGRAPRAVPGSGGVVTSHRGTGRGACSGAPSLSVRRYARALVARPRVLVDGSVGAPGEASAERRGLYFGYTPGAFTLCGEGAGSGGVTRMRWVLFPRGRGPSIGRSSGGYDRFPVPAADVIVSKLATIGLRRGAGRRRKELR